LPPITETKNWVSNICIDLRVFKPEGHLIYAGKKVQLLIQTRNLWGVTFLWPNKKVTKEVGIGEALTVKPFGTSSIDHLFYPNFKPPSPMYPSRPPSKDLF